MKILEQQETDTCTKTLKIEIPTDDIDKELDDVYKEFMENAAVPGFRKGKVPRTIAKMRYGKELKKEAVQKAMNEAFKKATEELDLNPIASPDIKELNEEPEGEAVQDQPEESKPIVFEVKFEYRPEPESVEYKDIEVEPPSNEVTESEVIDVLNRQREENAMFATIDDRPVAHGDHVTISCDATVDGEPFEEATHDEIVVQIGTGQYIKGFEEELIGMKTDEEKEIRLTIPEEHSLEEKRGKEGVFNVKVKQIRERKLPDLDDEFAKDLGEYETLDELKDTIRNNLKQRKEYEKQDQIYQSIREKLLERNPIEVPPSMVENRYNYINATQDRELQRMGSSLDSLVQRDEQHLERNRQRAVGDVKMSILLQKIGKEENIEVTDEEFSRHIQQVALQYNTDPGSFMRRLEAEGLTEFFRQEALEQKVLDELQKRMVKGSEPSQEEVTDSTQESEENQSGIDTDGSGADE